MERARQLTREHMAQVIPDKPCAENKPD